MFSESGDMEGSRVRLCCLRPSDGKEFIDVLGCFVSKSLGLLGSCQCWTLDRVLPKREFEPLPKRRNSKENPISGAVMVHAA